MNYEIEQQETDRRELKLKVHVSETRVEEAMREVALKHGRKVRIPGFRPGKAPYRIIQNWVGRDALRSDAVELIADTVYREALEQIQVEPFAPAAMEDIDMEPLVFHITVPLRPSVDLGDHRSVRVEVPAVEVSDDEVDKAMQAIQEKHALVEPASRPCQVGDLIVADLTAVQGGQKLIERQKAELLLDPEKLFRDQPFVDHVVGMSAGETRDFEINTAPEDAEPALATYTVMVHDVRSRFLPPINDDLARTDGAGSLLELRLDVRRRLAEAAQKRADDEYADQVFKQILAGAKVIFPPAALEHEIDQRVEEMEQQFKRQNWSLADFLKMEGLTQETFRDKFRPEAQAALERNQVMHALVEAEQLSLLPGDLDDYTDQQISEMSKLSEESAGQMREAYSTPEARAWLTGRALTAKFAERLRAIGRGEAPDLAEPVAPSEEEE